MKTHVTDTREPWRALLWIEHLTATAALSSAGGAYRSNILPILDTAIGGLISSKALATADQALALHALDNPASHAWLLDQVELLLADSNRLVHAQAGRWALVRSIASRGRTVISHILEDVLPGRAKRVRRDLGTLCDILLTVEKLATRAQGAA